MSNWKNLKTKILDAGGNNFIEVSLKLNPEGEKLIAISKGWYTEEKERRYRTNILFALDKAPELVKSILEVSENDN
jgi:hypothetical protein